MPYTIKPGSFKYKKSNGQFSEIDCFEGPDLTEEVAALEKGKAPIIIDSATGNPIVIKDGANGLPVEGMKIHFSPVQSGTGDPSPSNIRPISGFDGINVFRTGVNIWDEELELGGINSSTGVPYTSTTALRAKNYIPVVPGAKYYFKSPSTSVTRCWYDKDKNYISTGYVVNTEITVPDNAYFFRFDIPSSYGTTYNHDISLNYPSTDIAYHSYTGQTYPITFPIRTSNIFNGIWTQGNIAAGVEQPDTGSMRTGFIDVKPSTSYYGYTTRSAYVFVFEYDENGSYLGKYNNIATTPIFTTGTATKKIRIADRNSGTESVNTGINYPASVTSYEPFIKTIYGGNVDLVNGIVNVEWSGFDPQYYNEFSLNSTNENVSVFQCALTSMGLPVGKNGRLISNRFSTDITTGNPGRIVFNTDIIWFVLPTAELKSINSAGAKKWFQENQTIFVYQPLNVVYDLNPVTITTLLGDNTIWSDANGDIELDYRADTKLFVDNNNPVTDIRVKDTSLVQNGIVNMPLAQASTPGLMMVGAGYGLKAADINGNSAGRIQTDQAWPDLIKGFADQYRPITPKYLPDAVFQGLARAAGDTTQSASSNAIGTFTPEAIVAIQKMLGVYEAPWELIREDTVTNAEEADIEITVDGNGLAFELTDAVLLFETPVQNDESKKGDYGAFNIYKDNSNAKTVYVNEWTQAANATAKGCVIIVENHKNMIYVLARGGSASTNMGSLTSGYRAGFEGSTQTIFYDNTFTMKKFNIRKVTGTGHYKLYGRRKWTT